MAAPDRLIDALLPLLGQEGLLVGAEVQQRLAGIWRGDTVAAPVIFRPANTEQVAAVLRACHAAGQTVVTHGGLTGLVEGAIASNADVVLSTERLNEIETIDTVNRSMVVQAGVKLQVAQEYAAAHDLLLPLDLGARGSCTLGGNAATNAGGNRVIRYGMTRDIVLGLEAVLADGTVVTSLNSMLKNNAGFDLKHLFIGTEGTLGVITRLVLRLRPPAVSAEAALVACEHFSQLTQLLNFLDGALGGTLSAFEVMWEEFYTLVAAGAQSPPLPTGYPFYALVDALGGDTDGDRQRFLNAIEAALHKNLLVDAAVCKSGAERDQLWQLRDAVEKTMDGGPVQIFDVSMKLSTMEAYVAAVRNRLQNDFPGLRVWVFGHAGDGNLHLVCAGAADDAQRHAIERAVYEPLAGIGGSVSGEHGIGLEKKGWLPLSRSAAEIALMKQLKAVFDPRGILNPGRVIDT